LSLNNLKISKEIYPVKEDSFLLKDSILLEKLIGKKCLDLGSGSGIQAYAMFSAGANEVISVDINPYVINLLKKTKSQIVGQSMNNPSDLKKTNIFYNLKFFDFSKKKWKLIVSDLFSNLNGEKFDFIAFNPPYVPTDEIKWVDLDGGKKGREVIDCFIEQFPKYLSSNGVVLLLVSSLNSLDEVVSLISSKGFNVSIISEKKLFFEILYILRIIRS
jgi:release factor glutamine methyltransferase